MQGSTLISPSSIVLTVGTHAGPDALDGRAAGRRAGFAARVANIAISSSPVAMIFGADPDFQYFREPDSDAGRMSATRRDGRIFRRWFRRRSAQGRIGGAGLPSRFARTLQGKGDYPGIDRFKDIVLKKGKLIYAGFPARAISIRRPTPSGGPATAPARLNRGLQIAPHRVRPMRTQYAAYEVVEDTPAAFWSCTRERAAWNWLASADRSTFVRDQPALRGRLPAGAVR